jgi:predicted enzyme related to lactoylglutathione lyase
MTPPLPEYRGACLGLTGGGAQGVRDLLRHGADVQEALDKVGKAGGATVTPPMDVPGGPTNAFFSDPAGNRIGLMKAM